MNHIEVSKAINTILGALAVLSAEVSLVTFNMHGVPHDAALLPLGVGLSLALILAIRVGVAWRAKASHEQTKAQYQRTLKAAAHREQQQRRAQAERELDRELFANQQRRVY